jgi:protein-disulfide isomerase
MKAAAYSDCASRAANGDAFWKYAESIFENQEGITPANADVKLRDLAGAAGFSADKLTECATLGETRARVQRSLELGQSLDVNRTPTVFVNGRRVVAIEEIP